MNYVSLFVGLLMIAGAGRIGFASDLKSQIQMMLEERHPSGDLGEWKKLGSRAPEIMIHLIETSQRMDQQARLLAGLGAFETPQVVRYLKKKSNSTTTDSILRCEAIRSLGRSQNRKELKFISGFLKHEDPQTRLAAAETLKEMNHFEADLILGDYVTHEKTHWIVSRLNGDFPNPAQNLRSHQKKRFQSQTDILLGEWRGFWISSVNSKALTSENAILTISKNPAQDMTGWVTVQRKDGIKRLKLTEFKRGSKQFSGQILDETLNSKPAPFLAELLETETQVLINLKITSQGDVLVVQKNMVP